MRYKARIILLFLYSLACGYISPYWSVLIPKITTQWAQIYLILLTLIIFTFENIKELILFPIYNRMIYEIKLKTNQQFLKKSIDDINPGAINARFQRAYSNKYMIRSFFRSTRNFFSLISTIILFFHLDTTSGIFASIFIIIYLFLLAKVQKQNKILRNISWQQTEETSQTNIDSLEQANLIKNNLIAQTTLEQALKNEFEKWNNYYYKYNVYLLLLAIFSVTIIIYATFKQKIELAFLAWHLEQNIKNFTSNIQITYSAYIDLSKFLEEETILKNKYNKSLTLTIKNLSIKKEEGFVGNINLKMQCQSISITGKNGVGKTRLALSIANLIEFKGVINSPNTIYISTQSKTNKINSLGQNILELIKKSINYDLIILDEALDILSQENLTHVLKLLENKKLIIISHNSKILNLAQASYELTQNIKLIKKT